MFEFRKFFSSKPEETSAASAKNRLQILIARERNGQEYDFMPKLQQEMFELIAKYVKEIKAEDVKVSLDKTGDMEVLDVNVTLPPMVAAG